MPKIYQRKMQISRTFSMVARRNPACGKFNLTVISRVVMTRRIGSIAANHLKSKPGTTASNECNMNTDTADVYAYDKSLKPIEVYLL